MKKKVFIFPHLFANNFVGDDWEDAAQFVQDKFLGLNRNPNKVIHTHFCVATDGQSVNLVFKAVKDIIMRSMLADTD